jgi:DNA-binding NtrC family response regulator
MKDRKSIRGIILVEDVSFIRQMLANMLRSVTGAMVYQAEDGEEGMQIIDDNSVVADLLVCDISLRRGPDGVGLIREAMARRPSMKVVVVTGSAYDQDLVAKLKEMGVADIVPKPVDQVRIGQAVAQARHLM